MVSAVTPAGQHNPGRRYLIPRPQPVEQADHGAHMKMEQYVDFEQLNLTPEVGASVRNTSNRVDLNAILFLN